MIYSEEEKVLQLTIVHITEQKKIYKSCPETLWEFSEV